MAIKQVSGVARRPGLCAATLVGVSLLAGCATDPASRYAQASCTDLAQETQQAQRTLARYSGLTEDDPVTRAPGFLLWPAFAFLEEQRGNDDRYDELQSRYRALAVASAEKSCAIARPQPVNQAGVPVVPWTVDQAYGRPLQGHDADAPVGAHF